jgi:hypothetical protein
MSEETVLRWNPLTGKYEWNENYKPKKKRKRSQEPKAKVKVDEDEARRQRRADKWRSRGHIQTGDK